MLQASSQEKLTPIGQISLSRRREIFVEILTFISKYKTNKVDVSEVVTVYDSLNHFLDSRYKNMKLYEILQACEEGMIGSYGDDYKFSAATILKWFSSYYRLNGADRHRSNVQERQPELDQNKTIADASYPKAVLLRMKYNKGGLNEEYSKYSIDDIAIKIRLGINIFTSHKLINEDFEGVEVCNKEVSF